MKPPIKDMMNGEIGIDMYTLTCIKWITNKNLLYTKINKIKFKKKKFFRMQDEKNTVKGTPEENQISNCIPPCNATNHLFNLVYVLLTKENRFCYVFSNPGESIASV